MTSGFNRKIILTAGDLKLEAPEVTIEGVVPFSDSWIDDVATIRIYNVGDATVSRLRTNKTVELQAGYKGETGLIHEGIIRSIDNGKDGGDQVVTLRVGTGMSVIRDHFVSRTYRGSVSPDQITRDIAGNVKNVEIGNLRYPNETYPDKVFSQSAFSALFSVARDFDRTIYLSSLSIYTEPEDFLDPSRTIFQSRENGLQSASKMKDRKFDDQSYRTVSKLMHQVRAGSTVELQTDDVEGTFRAVSGRHDLTEFSTHVTLREAA